MISFSNQKFHVDPADYQHQTLEAPGDDSDDWQQQYISNDIQMQCERIDCIKQRLMEYQVILQRLRLLRSAKKDSKCHPKPSITRKGLKKKVS